jgi:ComF family protein
MVRAATIHHGAIRQAIHGLKYEAKPELGVALAPYLVATFEQAPWRTLHDAIDAVVPVPLHAERLATRGYNQAKLLAQAFSDWVKLPLHSHWLQRQHYTQSQVGLNHQQRQANVADAFWAAPAVAGRTLLLIDDVYTTGATLQACAKAARVAGARQVYALALATPDRFDLNLDQPLPDQGQTWPDGA